VKTIRVVVTKLAIVQAIEQMVLKYGLAWSVERNFHVMLVVQSAIAVCVRQRDELQMAKTCFPIGITK